MGRLRPGHFTLSPTDSDGSRTFQPKVVSSSDGGELTDYFTAEVVMSEEAYRRMALDKFKGIYWLEGKEESQQRNEEHYKQDEKSLSSRLIAGTIRAHPLNELHPYILRPLPGHHLLCYLLAVGCRHASIQ